MSRHFRPWTIDQTRLLPAAVVDYVPADHLAHFVVALAREHLDLSEIVASYKSGLGQPPFDPRMMTALLLYAYCSGLYSSRRIAKACAEREARCILPLMAKCRLHETWGERVRPNTLRSDLAGVIRRSLHLMLPVAERGYATHRTIGDVERPESFIPRPLAHLPGPVAFAPRQSSSLSREPPAGRAAYSTEHAFAQKVQPNTGLHHAHEGRTV